MDCEPLRIVSEEEMKVLELLPLSERVDWLEHHWPVLQQFRHAWERERGAHLRRAFSREETAEILGISTDSVDRLRKAGELNPSIALGRPLYSSDEIDRFLHDTKARV